MKIDYAIRNKWHSGFMRHEYPSEIILHGTGGPGTYKYVLSGGRVSEYVRGVALFHYLIDEDETTEIISPDRWVYHSSSGKHDRKTIGIELLNSSRKNENPYSDNQYRQLFDLMIDLFERYPIEIIMSHNMSKQIFSGGEKVCPGNFDWERLEQWLTDSQFQWEAGTNEVYRIKREYDEI